MNIEYRTPNPEFRSLTSVFTSSFIIRRSIFIIQKRMFLNLLLILLSVTLIAPTNAMVKVYILAGQSNMEGHGFIETAQRHLDRNGGKGTLQYHVENDPEGTFAHLVDGQGNWVERDDAWVHYVRFTEELMVGNLSTTFGPFWDTFGPELQFGHYMADHHEEQILIIKTAWGGKSLVGDFRPPSSGGTTGEYYNRMISTVNDVLDNIGTHFPDYANEGYEISGFGWHQGWNDWVNDAAIAEYPENMANFIRDVRTDLETPDLPFVIAESGLACWDENNEKGQTFCANQTSPASLAEFEGTVAGVETRDYWVDEADSPANSAHHWNNNGYSYFMVGNSMAEAMVELVSESNDVPGGKKASDISIQAQPGIGWVLTSDIPGYKEVSLFDVRGTEIMAQSGTFERFVLNFPSRQGIFFLQLISDRGTSVHRVTHF